MGAGPYAQPRRSERKPQKMEITLLGKTAGVEFEQPAHTVDISEHGLRIQTDDPVSEARPLTPGQMVYAYGIAFGYCRVVWVHTENANACSQAGLSFVN